MTNQNKTLGIIGIKGKIYQLAANNRVLLDDSGNPEIYYRNGTPATNGFYKIDYRIDYLEKFVEVKMTPYLTLKKFIRNPNEPVYKAITVIIQDRPSTIQDDGTITTPAITVFDQYFARSVVRARNTSELDRVLDFITTELNGSHELQAFKVDFTTHKDLSGTPLSGDLVNMKVITIDANDITQAFA